MIASERGDTVARRRLVEAFMPAIASLARQFPAVRVERQDLLQEGIAGLLFAAHRYDTRLGTPFWAYASFWVRKSMQELVADLGRPVALSDRAVTVIRSVEARSLLPRISDDPEHFVCRFCPYLQRCHRLGAAA